MRFEPGRIEISLTPEAESDLPQRLSRILQEWTGDRWIIVVGQEKAAETVHETRQRSRAALMEEVRADPLVRQVLERFPGAEIVEVRERGGIASGELPADDRCDDQARRARRGVTMRDFMGMMKQAKELQEKMQALQSEIAALEATGTSGAGLVTVTVDGKGGLKTVKIDPSLATPGEIEILEDLIVAAARDARSKVDAEAQAKMQSLTAGLPLPPGLNLPF